MINRCVHQTNISRVYLAILILYYSIKQEASAYEIKFFITSMSRGMFEIHTCYNSAVKICNIQWNVVVWFSILIVILSFFEIKQRFYWSTYFQKTNGSYELSLLTHWGRVTHICGDNLTVIGSDNGLSPGRRQAIIWTNAGILLIAPWGTNFSEVLIDIHTFSFKKIDLKMSSAKWRPFCLGLNVLNVELGTNWPGYELSWYESSWV